MTGLVLGSLIAVLAGWKSYDLATAAGRWVGRRIMAKAFAHDVQRAVRTVPAPDGDP